MIDDMIQKWGGGEVVTATSPSRHGIRLGEEVGQLSLSRSLSTVFIQYFGGCS